MIIFITVSAHCPTCERFIGPREVCPYCGVQQKNMGLLRAGKYGAIALALFGLLLLNMISKQSDSPLIQVSEITPMMNYARVRLSGKVASKPRVYRKDGEIDYVSIMMNDGSGQIIVSARGSVAQALALPKKGNVVNATGSLRVNSNGKTKLYLQSTDDFELKTN